MIYCSRAVKWPHPPPQRLPPLWLVIPPFVSRLLLLVWLVTQLFSHAGVLIDTSRLNCTLSSCRHFTPELLVWYWPWPKFQPPLLAIARCSEHVHLHRVTVLTRRGDSVITLLQSRHPHMSSVFFFPSCHLHLLRRSFAAITENKTGFTVTL